MVDRTTCGSPPSRASLALPCALPLPSLWPPSPSTCRCPSSLHARPPSPPSDAHGKEQKRKEEEVDLLHPPSFHPSLPNFLRIITLWEATCLPPAPSPTRSHRGSPCRPPTRPSTHSLLPGPPTPTPWPAPPPPLLPLKRREHLSEYKRYDYFYCTKVYASAVLFFLPYFPFFLSFSFFACVCNCYVMICYTIRSYAGSLR